MRHVAGHEQGATASDEGWLDDIARPVRPAPAVVPAHHFPPINSPMMPLGPILSGMMPSLVAQRASQACK